MAGLPAALQTPLPLAVLDPAFGMVIDAAEERLLQQLSDRALAADTLDLMSAAADVYNCKDQRNEKILEHLRSMLGIKTPDSDGLAIVRTQSGSPVLLAKLTAAGETDLQSICSYLRHYVPPDVGASRGVPLDLLGTMPLCPALLLDIHGGVALSVRGIVITGYCVLSEVLASAHLVGSPYSPQRWALARLLRGVKAALGSHASRVEAVAATTKTAQRGQIPPRVPPPIQEHLGGLLPRRLVTDEGLLLVDAGAPLTQKRLVFAGRCVAVGDIAVAAVETGAATGAAAGAGAGLPPTATGAPCVVKLVARRYGADAHRRAHATGAAPRLFGIASLPGGWHGVVMEELACTDGWLEWRARGTCASSTLTGPARRARRATR